MEGLEYVSVLEVIGLVAHFVLAKVTQLKIKRLVRATSFVVPLFDRSPKNQIYLRD